MPKTIKTFWKDYWWAVLLSIPPVILFVVLPLKVFALVFSLYSLAVSVWSVFYV